MGGLLISTYIFNGARWMTFHMDKWRLLPIAHSGASISQLPFVLHFTVLTPAFLKCSPTCQSELDLIPSSCFPVLNKVQSRVCNKRLKHWLKCDPYNLIGFISLQGPYVHRVARDAVYWNEDQQKGRRGRRPHAKSITP